MKMPEATAQRAADHDDDQARAGVAQVGKRWPKQTMRT
jgi:hypothetical protein